MYLLFIPPTHAHGRESCLEAVAAGLAGLLSFFGETTKIVRYESKKTKTFKVFNVLKDKKKST